MKADPRINSRRKKKRDRASTDSALLQKYLALVGAHQQLLKDHSEMIQRYRAIAHERDEASMDWGVGIANALVLLRNGAIMMTNKGFRELDKRAASDGWRELKTDDQTGESARYRSLRECMRAICRRAIDQNKDFLESHCETGGGAAFVDVRVQRSVAAATYIGIATDVTARVRAENELAAAREAQFHAERMRSLGALSSGLAHDVNNSLNALKLHLSILMMNPAKLPDRLPTINRIVDDCAALVKRLQDFSGQRRDPPLGHCRIEKVIEEAVQTAQAELVEKTAMTDKPVTVAADVPPLPAVPGDPVELRHVFVNLLLNARDAMPDGGKIEITGCVKGDRLIVSVADEGKGIPSEVMGRLFDPFFTTKGPHGTGLGLAVAYGVMSRLGGDIRAENRPQGGAVLILTFPIAHASEEREPRQSPSANRASAPRRILAIDDRAENIEPLKMLLEAEGHRVDLAFSGGEAVERVRRGDVYDVVLCDVGMPEMNGWQVAQRLREMTPGVAIYLLTGWAQEIAPDEPRGALIDGVIAKPVQPERLVEAIARPRRPMPRRPERATKRHGRLRGVCDDLVRRSTAEEDS
jgi:signal transduction histidine kinase/FixJ family two-component response regulator